MINFRYEYVSISSEQNYFFGEYCGQRTGQTVLVGGDYALITFRSIGHGRGFILRFSTIPVGMYFPYRYEYGNVEL